MRQSNVSEDNVAKTEDQRPDLEEQTSASTFEKLYCDYSKRVLNLAYRFTGQQELARDLTQDIFMKVYQNLETFREESHVYTWIHRIALNHIMNYLKRERRFKWFSLLDEDIGDVLHNERIDQSLWGQTGSPSPDRILEQSERDNILWSAVESLPVKYRVPFVLFRFDGISYQGIADTMQLSLSAVEARIHRAKKQLIKKLEPWLDHI